MPRLRKEDGHAVLEAIVFGLVLLVPVFWMLAVVAELHAVALGASSASREAGFEAARTTSRVEGDRRVMEIVARTMNDHGLDHNRSSVRWVPAPGWRRGGQIEVVVAYSVPAFQIPLLGELPEPSLVVTARHVATIDRYRSRE